MPSWICDGVPKDGKSYPDVEAHEPFENYGPDCAICGLPKEALVVKRRGPSIPAPVMAGVAVLLGLGLIGGAGYLLWPKGCPEGTVKVGEICIPDAEPTPLSSPSPAAATSPPPGAPAGLPASAPERYSRGERRLITVKSSTQGDLGAQAFAAGDYPAARQFFENAIQGNRNDPEVQIYANNTQARMMGMSLVLATVVPVDAALSSAEEILRGIADAQTDFNNAGGWNGRMLEILIANDGNDPGIAGGVAQQLVNNPDVLGVIGHNSSESSAAGLIVYEQNSLAMVSPTSTSVSLSGSAFFRTVPSDQVYGQRLAEYARTALQLQGVAIFYDTQSNYSTSIQQAFSDEFQQLGGQVRFIDMSNTTLDIDTEVNNMAGQVQGLVMLPSTTGITLAIEAAVANSNLPPDQKMQLLGGDSLYRPETLTAGGSAIEDLILVVPWFAETPYADKAEQRWLGQISWRTAMSYDATLALLQAIQNLPAGTVPSRADISQNLQTVFIPAEQTSGYELQFLSTGDRTTNPILVHAVQGPGGPLGSQFAFRPIRNPLW